MIATIYVSIVLGGFALVSLSYTVFELTREIRRYFKSRSKKGR